MKSTETMKPTSEQAKQYLELEEQEAEGNLQPGTYGADRLDELRMKFGSEAFQKKTKARKGFGEMNLEEQIEYLVKNEIGACNPCSLVHLQRYVREQQTAEPDILKLTLDFKVIQVMARMFNQGIIAHYDEDTSMIDPAFDFGPNFKNDLVPDEDFEEEVTQVLVEVDDGFMKFNNMEEARAWSEKSARATRAVIEALEFELFQRTGTVDGQCHCCGGVRLSGRLNYHFDCCGNTRDVLQRLKKQVEGGSK